MNKVIYRKNAVAIPDPLQAEHKVFLKVLNL